MRQQIIMHYMSDTIMDIGAHADRFDMTARQKPLTDKCLVLVDEIIENNGYRGTDAFAEHTTYNIDYFYTFTERNMMDVPNKEAIILFIERLESDNLQVFNRLRDEYCTVVYQCLYSELEEDDRRYVDDLTDDESLHQLQGTIMRLKEERKTRDEVVAEEELTPQQRTIRWAAQRGGAVSIE